MDPGTLSDCDECFDVRRRITNNTLKQWPFVAVCVAGQDAAPYTSVPPVTCNLYGSQIATTAKPYCPKINSKQLVVK
jgi:hypothetical protein